MTLPKAEPVRIAVLDGYQNVALSMADWSGLDKRAAITVFNDHMADPGAVVARLQSFDIVCVMRERTPMTRAIIERLPRLRLIASTALRNASIDLEAAAERGVEVMHTGYSSTPTIELTWALILASARLVDAVRCAIEVQNAMVERNAGVPEDSRIVFRIGIHLGGPSRKRRRNRRESTRTGRKKPPLQAIQRAPSGDRPPPGTMTWRCG